jgi:hypothetical protein
MWRSERLSSRTPDSKKSTMAPFRSAIRSSGPTVVKELEERLGADLGVFGIEKRFDELKICGPR